MNLKGFKSFASSTTLNFEQGITCVVGPNGSGKSNVVDALSWVMGEQGAKSLRGGKMEDVIFAGTSGRAPLGRAEVSVTIDNTDGVLPIDFTEVTITRVLFRNGASEYLLNGETTRLLDIQELLSDSGIGREMHVIVGQGQLDAILLANPEERRAFIEEAAGVLKHRKRKEKAIRKLDSMQTNLARIQDLTVELRRQLKPLGKQAEVARKASIIQSDVRDAKLRLMADDMLRMRNEMELEVADENVLRQRKEQVESELNSARSREIELDTIAASENPQLIAAQENFYRLTAQREQIRAVQNLSSERARFLSEEAEEAKASGRDPVLLDQEAQQLRNEEKELANNVNKSQEQLDTDSNLLKAIEDKLALEESRVSAALRAIADQREGTARQEGHINGLRSRIDATSGEVNRLTEARNSVEQRLKNYRENFATIETQISSLAASEPGLDSLFEKLKVEMKNSEKDLKVLTEKLQSTEKLRAGSLGRLTAFKEITELVKTSENTSLISKVDDLTSNCEVEVNKVSVDCDRIRFELSSANDDFNKISSEYESVLSKLNESDAAMTGLAEQLAISGQNVKNSVDEFDRLNSALQAAIDQRNSDERDLAAALAQFESHQTPVEPDLTNLEDLRSQVSGARSKEVESRLNLRTIEERKDALSQRAEALENQAAAERESASRSISRRENRAQAAITAQDIADTAYEALIQIESSIARAGSERERLETSRSSREGEILSLRTIGRELSIELEKLTSSVHKDEIARAEQRLRIEQLETKAVEELGIDVQALINEYGPSNDVPTFYENEQGEFVPGDLIPYRRDQQEKRLSQAEKSLILLGKINPLALEEYSSLEERLRYLAEQLEDLKKTKKDLLDIIKEVDDRVQQIFTEAYEDTAREFELVFARLFPGGDGKLILTNPSDILTSGVDVEARPPGKRVKRLSLLSGGERSLVAVALLIAIFKARPSPFYVMDEVEAALDDTNLGRLLGVFEELREKSQLIIITHQKRTMEIADALYGVTMRGDGVSEVISQRIREVDAVS
ncbi:MAG: recombination protein RecF [Actinobacteria bacterium BACL4 MAG-121001-bin59]|nr:MAG: recombination protein RecF [Actinobacteria bacterium BACL4 MAG-121001-bin59]